MEEFVRLYKNIHKHCSYYCRHLGHLKGLIGNDDWIRVVDGSMSGRALALGNSEIINALVLFNTRMFDTGRDAITIHSLCRNLPSDLEIEQYHSERMAKIGITYEIERYFAAKRQFVELNRRVRNNSTLSQLKSLRDYTLAHNIDPKTKFDRATLKDLLDLTERVHEIVDQAGYIVESSRNVYRDFPKRAEKETRMLCAALPMLASIERE
ncbi:AbiU2 domain-containing protein [Roseovarius aquimarinus]|uniref:HEPN AbiU2-like domain-containing protein n=1 Tax=Roseovarius aquimarinus TaxID=1229156 RepID=A0ABW7I6I3_9RHOB